MIVPNKSYRLDPARAIYVTGLISDEMVTKLTPRILFLQSKSRDPISVYIDSPGGSPSSMEVLLRLLNLTDQNQAAACDIITSVTTRAASAAADLLSSGDYAIAFPGSTVFHHGIRKFERDPLTLESTSVLGELLRIYNDVYAMQLAQKIENRFSFRYVTARSEFDGFRQKKANPAMSELECFIGVIEEHLSNDAKKLWKKAKERHGRYHDLIAIVLQKAQSPANSLVEAQASVLKAIVDFEVTSNANNPSWNFRSGGLGRMVDDFFLLEEYIGNTNSDRLKEWCTSFGKWTLDAQQTAEVDRPILQPIWTFFVALCHALQEGENELTATDAYWLGLVDEVLGEDLFSIRELEEFQPDPTEEMEDNEKAGDAPQEEADKAGAATGTPEN